MGMSLEGSEDLTRERVADLLPERPLRVYPALLSTEAEAMAWARRGAPDGALVVAGYQASPRGRSGLEWAGEQEAGRGLGFSLVLRPDLPADREGWLYVVALAALADVLLGQGGGALHWPDEIRDQSRLRAAVGVQTEPSGDRLRWAVVNVLVPGADPPRAPLLAQLVEAVTTRARQAPQRVLDDYREGCATLGRRVRARLLPLGPAAPTVTGAARDVLEDGALVIETDEDERVAVTPHGLGHVEEPDEGDGPSPWDEP